MSSAKRFKLVPEALWKHIREGGVHRENVTATENEKPCGIYSNNVDTLQVEVINVDGHASERIIEDLPKQCRRKAQIILNYIRSSLKLDNKMRIIYPDGTCGGHISDLLQWTTCSKMLADRMERPIDCSAWLELLCAHNVPPTCYKNRMHSNVLVSNNTNCETNAEKREKKTNKKMKWLTKLP